MALFTKWKNTSNETVDTGKVYYLDATNGNDSWDGDKQKPWKTITKAQAVATEGDTVFVYDGDYGEFAESTDRTMYLRYKAVSGETPVLTNIAINGSGTPTPIDSCLIFDGFTIEEGVTIPSASHLKFKNCSVLIDGDYAISGVSSDYVTIENCDLSQKEASIYEYGTFWVSRNNTVHNAITVDVDASRISGVAPLAVFFDATGTTLTDTEFFATDNESVNGSYMDATFHWNFDYTNIDATIDHKYASGFVAACVFKEPGEYTTRCTVYDADENVAYKNTTITVSAFSGTTYYVASNGSNSNDGSIEHPFLTVIYALTGAHVQNNTRILFRNGDTFNTGYFTINAGTTGVVVGGYSDPNSPSSTKPIIHSTATSHYFMGECNANDWRFMDIEISSGGTTSAPAYPGGIFLAETTQNILMYRIKGHTFGNSPLAPWGTYNTFAECEFYNATGEGYSDSSSGHNTGNALIGNYVHDMVSGYATFRLQGGGKYYIAHNDWSDNDYTDYGQSLTIRGTTEKVVVYKNEFGGWMENVSPQNLNSAHEHQHHIIFDSNLFYGLSDYENERQISTRIIAKDIVFRNNIVYDYTYSILAMDDTVVGTSNRIKIYNNTIINPTGSFNVFNTDGLVENIFLRNNLVLDVAGSGNHRFIYYWGTAASNLSSDYNMFYGTNWGASPVLFNAQTLAAWVSATGNDSHSSVSNPDLLSTTIGNANFAKPSAAIAGQTILYNVLDYYGNERGSSHDIGACEH